jgi:hypothetical protein
MRLAVTESTEQNNNLRASTSSTGTFASLFFMLMDQKDVHQATDM